MYYTSLTSYSINATGSQRGLSSQPCFIEVANPREQPYSGIKRPDAQHQPKASPGRSNDRNWPKNQTILTRPPTAGQPASLLACPNKGLQIRVRHLARWSDIIIGYIGKIKYFLLDLKNLFNQSSKYPYLRSSGCFPPWKENENTYCVKSWLSLVMILPPYCYHLFERLSVHIQNDRINMF